MHMFGMDLSSFHFNWTWKESLEVQVCSLSSQIRLIRHFKLLAWCCFSYHNRFYSSWASRKFWTFPCKVQFNSEFAYKYNSWIKTIIPTLLRFSLFHRWIEHIVVGCILALLAQQWSAPHIQIKLRVVEQHLLQLGNPIDVGETLPLLLHSTILEPHLYILHYY